MGNVKGLEDPRTIAGLLIKNRAEGVLLSILGGPKIDSVEALLHMVRDVIDAGARGVVFGRNIWGYEKMESLVDALKDIVHGGSAVSSVVKNRVPRPF